MKTKLNEGAFTSRLFLFYGLVIAAWAGTTGVWWTVFAAIPFVVIAVLRPK